jgi:succinate dehydrogenase hydrophobic anchor subunit
MSISTPKAREGVWLWLLKIVAGLLVFVVLGIHLVVNHMTAPEGLLTYSDVVRYYQNPIIVAMEISFLVVVVTHALVGLRSIILDLNPSDRILTLVNWLFTIAGASAIIYGTWLALVIAQRSPGAGG